MNYFKTFESFNNDEEAIGDWIVTWRSQEENINLKKISIGHLKNLYRWFKDRFSETAADIIEAEIERRSTRVVSQQFNRACKEFYDYYSKRPEVKTKLIVKPKA
jgi:hypothetical protein